MVLFERRCIPPDGVVRRLPLRPVCAVPHAWSRHGRSWPAGALQPAGAPAAPGATRDFTTGRCGDGGMVPRNPRTAGACSPWPLPAGMTPALRRHAPGAPRSRVRSASLSTRHFFARNREAAGQSVEQQAEGRIPSRGETPQRGDGADAAPRDLHLLPAPEIRCRVNAPQRQHRHAEGPNAVAADAGLARRNELNEPQRIHQMRAGDPPRARPLLGQTRGRPVPPAAPAGRSPLSGRRRAATSTPRGADPPRRPSECSSSEGPVRMRPPAGGVRRAVPRSRSSSRRKARSASRRPRLRPRNSTDPAPAGPAAPPEVSSC